LPPFVSVPGVHVEVVKARDRIDKIYDASGNIRDFLCRSIYTLSRL
jgi:hypothetical protein